MSNPIKKYGAIVEGKYHYDLINVDIPDEQNVLPYAPRWIEKFPERFSAYKTKEALKKGLALISRRHYHPKPVDMPTPMPVYIAIRLAHDTLIDDGFLIAPLRYDLSTSDTEYEYILQCLLSRKPMNSFVG